MPLVWIKIHLANSVIEGYIEQGLSELLKRSVWDRDNGKVSTLECALYDTSRRPSPDYRLITLKIKEISAIEVR